jgi:hypothetical protein
VRLEDLCYLGPGGLEVLTPLPYDLDPRRWTGLPPSPAAPPPSQEDGALAPRLL